MNNPLDENPDKYKKEDIEHSRNQMALNKSINIIEKNPSTSTKRFEEPQAVIVEIESTVVPHNADQTLQRLGYSKISLSKVLEYEPTGELVYPVSTGVLTYGLDGSEKNAFFINEVSTTKITIEVEDKEGELAVGFDAGDGAPTFDPMQFDSNQPSGFIPNARPLRPQEELEFRSVLDVCELTVANIEP